jgi:hypothetical protein
MNARFDAVLTTQPPPLSMSAGIPCLQIRNVPHRSSLMTRQNSSTGASVTPASSVVEPPALL